MTKKAYLLLILWILPFSISACSEAQSANRIAAAPLNTPIAVFPEYQPVLYNTSIELKVSDVDAAAERSVQYAANYGGYLVSSQAWYVDGRKNTILVLAVPPSNFERLRHALVTLGDLVSENISSDRISRRYPDPISGFSQITLHLRPREIFIPALDSPGWNPARTFQRAISVFVAIFSFLADIAIWIIVVGGPFILTGWLIWMGIKRFRKLS